MSHSLILMILILFIGVIVFAGTVLALLVVAAGKND